MEEIKFITIDPGHFHAALVQKSMYPQVDSVVNIYAPPGPDLALHLYRINKFNTRPENPTGWKIFVYSAPDFFEKCIEEKKGNVVILSGNNQKKTEYIASAIDAGFHVYADKPMAINHSDFEQLEIAFAAAQKNDLLLYDIMTERFEINTILQKELSLIPEIFGELQKGSAENPAVTKESVHHFYKFVAGDVLTRPSWFFDVTQAGEGIVDVTTHLVDLIQWECFPGQVIDYKDDIEITSAKRWTTNLTAEQFKSVTKSDSFPKYLKKDLNDVLLKVFCNGQINYKIKDVHARVSVTWAYKAPEGTGDTHYSIMRGSKANLVIRQGEKEDYKATLYIEPVNGAEIDIKLFSKIEKLYPGVSLKTQDNGWQVIVPQKYHVGHEAHFAQVTEKFIEYFKNGTMPDWEIPNMIAKYYITTKALEIALKK